MQRRGLVNLAATALCGVIVGVAVAGLPEKSENDIRITAAEATALESTTTSTTTTTTLPPDVSAAVTTSALSAGSAGGTDGTTTTDDTQPATTQPATTQPATIQPATTTTGSTPTTTTPIPVTTTTVLARDEVRVLVANAAERRGIAAAARDRIQDLGYPLVTADDSLVVLPDTVMVAAEEYVPWARQLIADLGLSQDILRVRGEDAITTEDGRADVIVVLGEDWIG